MLAIILSVLCTFAIVWSGLAIAYAKRFKLGRKHRAWFTVVLLGLSGVLSFLAGYLLGGFSESLFLYALGGIAFSIMIALPCIMDQ